MTDLATGLSEENLTLAREVTGWPLDATSTISLPKSHLNRLLDAARREGRLAQAKLHASDIAEAFAARAQGPRQDGEGKAVAWRVKDFADGWILYGESEAEARKYAAESGAVIEPLYASPPRQDGEFVLVPREPTEEMKLRGARQLKFNDLLFAGRSDPVPTDAHSCWMAMLAALPSASPVPTLPEVGGSSRTEPKDPCGDAQERATEGDQ